VYLNQQPATTFAATLEPVTQSVALARHTLEEWAREVDALTVIETAVLLVSEVATNVVKYAGTTFTMSAYWLPPILRIEVTDSAPVPKRATRGPGQVGGWGFTLLEELSRAWGIDERSGGSKVVWFEVEQPRLRSEPDLASTTAPAICSKVVFVSCARVTIKTIA
jgi:anti-sigma regulatory factor (Ser/Thr protein kinase)